MLLARQQQHPALLLPALLLPVLQLPARAAFDAAEPEQAALALDDSCEDGSACSLSLLQARGRAFQTEDLEEGQPPNFPPWLWNILHPPGSYVPPSYTPPNYVPPSYRPPGYAPPEISVYLYRAKGPKNFDDTDVNMANLAGVMWYLHNEVVRICPRKFGITRVLRYKVTVKPTPQLGRRMFAQLCHFDSGACTGPSSALNDYTKYGYVVGCDKPSTHTAAYANATWFSLPGRCPRQSFAAKQRDPTCAWRDPGGECAAGAPWSNTCTWRKEYAGEVSLEELTGIRDYENWCKQGNYEWNEKCDCGRGTSFWNGKRNAAACVRRTEALRQRFQQKYGNMPADLGEAHCPNGDPRR